MEGLMQLVAAAFVRYGIESPAENETPSPTAVRPEPTLPTSLPEHNYRKVIAADSAP